MTASVLFYLFLASFNSPYPPLAGAFSHLSATWIKKMNGNTLRVVDTQPKLCKEVYSSSYCFFSIRRIILHVVDQPTNKLI